MTTDAFDRVMRRRNPDMLVVTTAVDGQRAGCLVGFHSQCSIDPVRYAVWLSKTNHTCQLALQATHFGLHFLAESDERLAEIFGTLCSDSTDKFALVDWHADLGDVPIIDACENWAVARRTGFVDEGSDHICFVVEPIAARSHDPLTPLRFETVMHLDPGHAPQAHDPDDSDSSNATGRDT